MDNPIPEPLLALRDAQNSESTFTPRDIRIFLDNHFRLIRQPSLSLPPNQPSEDNIADIVRHTTSGFMRAINATNSIDSDPNWQWQSQPRKIKSNFGLMRMGLICSLCYATPKSQASDNNWRAEALRAEWLSNITTLCNVEHSQFHTAMPILDCFRSIVERSMILRFISSDILLFAARPIKHGIKMDGFQCLHAESCFTKIKKKQGLNIRGPQSTWALLVSAVGHVSLPSYFLTSRYRIGEPLFPNQENTDWKDIIISFNKRPRKSLTYPKTPSSIHGIQKASRPLSALVTSVRQTLRSTRLVSRQRRQGLRIRGAEYQKRKSAPLEEEYYDEICHYMHDMERRTLLLTDSMVHQPEIRPRMRPNLVDFILEIHLTCCLCPETLYLTFNIMDRYVSRKVVCARDYQLVGCVSLWIAAKFEDFRIPTIREFILVCQEEYEESEFIQMESQILSTIQWDLGLPTPEAWLKLMYSDLRLQNARVQNVARFLMEITLFYHEFVNYRPSTIALASLTLAHQLCGEPRGRWEETDESLEVIKYLEIRLSEDERGNFPGTLLEKYSRAATFVLDFYPPSDRFSTPSSPSSSITTEGPETAAMSTMSPPASLSDLPDDMPITPTTPTLH